MTLRIPLDPTHWGARHVVVDGDGFHVESFRFASGLAALAIESSALNLVVLPFTGQQIWRASAFGRELTMRSTFDEPVDTERYLENNGAYFIHCGGSAMGNPGPSDDHPLHGELPNARLTDCELHFDSVAGTLALVGSVTRRVSFGPFFRADLSIRVRRDDSVMESTARITNLSAEPRPLMYLAHINMRPAIGGHIAEDLIAGEQPSTREDFAITINGTARTVPVSQANDLGIGPLLAPGVRVEPELVQTIPSARIDGWTTVRQVHASGEVDVVSYSGDDLTHTLRWLRRSADDDAFGFALPATAEADGFASESAKGNVRQYLPGDSLVATIRHGAETPGDPAGHPTERNTNDD